MQTHGLRLANL